MTAYHTTTSVPVVLIYWETALHFIGGLQDLFFFSPATVCTVCNFDEKLMSAHDWKPRRSSAHPKKWPDVWKAERSRATPAGLRFRVFQTQGGVTRSDYLSSGFSNNTDRCKPLRTSTCQRSIPALKADTFSLSHTHAHA